MKKKFVTLSAFILALLMILSMTSLVFATTWTYQDRITVQIGEPVYIVWDASPATTGTLTKVDSSSTYYPEDFVLWVGDGSAPTVSAGSATLLHESTGLLDDGVTEVTNRGYQIHLTGSGTIKVTIDNVEYTISNSAPAGDPPSLSKPTGFNGFLPVGQFATGVGWGSIYKNKTNLNGTNYKFFAGYCSPGISLGAAGGYVDYNFYASNASTHTYGIDFIVCGNAFDGNPEAGAVKVFGFTSPTDTTGEWYDLAGSLYYADNSMHNKDVSWKLDSNNDLYYSVTNHGTAPSTWNLFRSSSLGWWPFTGNRGYDSINGMTTSTAFSTDDVSVSADRSQITFKDVCIVKDTDVNNDYKFGYFDVNGSISANGNPVNPYHATANGGDCFDLSWAVNSSGEPVRLDHITKVRLYTAAALNSTGTGFDTTLTFGETSAEVNAVVGVNGDDGSGASETVDIIKGGTTIHPDGFATTPISVSGSIYLSFETYADNMYINGIRRADGWGDTFTVGSGDTKYIQIISQTGYEEPYITVLKLQG